MKVLRRAPPVTFALGDFVLHAQHGTGRIDAIVYSRPTHYCIALWDGRGRMPGLAHHAPRCIATARELTAQELPRPVFVRRR